MSDGIDELGDLAVDSIKWVVKAIGICAILKVLEAHIELSGYETFWLWFGAMVLLP